MAAHFPKILFVNDFAPDALALADLVRQLLRGYPPDRIAWWYWRDSRLGTVSDFRVHRVHRWPLPKKAIPGRRLASIKCSMMENLWVPLAARHLNKTISAEKPDMIWPLLFSWPIMVARRAGLGHGTPLHTSLWDMPNTVDFLRILGPRRAERFLVSAYDLIRRARSCDGISKAVLEEIAARTSRRDGLLVHSGFEPDHLRALEAAGAPAPDDPLRIAYVGTIISEQSFMTVLSALDAVRAQSSKPVTLEFYGARGYASRSWFNPAWMVEHGVFSDQDLIISLQRCSWGVVVMDLESEDPRYSRFSFPNKIGTYLSAGVPVLGFGHAATTLAQIMNDYRMGAFTSASELEAIKQFLSETLLVPQPRLLFRDDLLRCARTEFNAADIRKRLWTAWGATGF